MSTDNDSHDFEIKNYKSDELPNNIFAPKQCAFCGNWRVRFIVIPSDFISCHNIVFLKNVLIKSRSVDKHKILIISFLHSNI